MALNVPKGYFVSRKVRQAMALSPKATGYIGIDYGPNYKRKRDDRFAAVRIEKYIDGFPNGKLKFRASLDFGYNEKADWQTFDDLQTLVTVMCAKHRMRGK